VRASQCDGLVVPGGFMPDRLRREARVLEIVREFNVAGMLIAAVCHGGWIPISAGVYRGVRVTGSPGLKDDLLNAGAVWGDGRVAVHTHFVHSRTHEIREDLINAGAVWEDAAVVIDRHFVSSRKPDDLPDFCRGILQVFAAK